MLYINFDDPDRPKKPGYTNASGAIRDDEMVAAANTKLDSKLRCRIREVAVGLWPDDGDAIVDCLCGFRSKASLDRSVTQQANSKRMIWRVRALQRVLDDDCEFQRLLEERG